MSDKRLDKDSGQIVQGVKLSLDTHLQISRITKEYTETNVENIRYQQDFILEYMGMLKVLDALIWGRNLMPQLEFPFSWWDAIKLKVFPRWLLMRYPAMVRTVNLMELFPQVSKNPGVVKLEDFLKTKNSVTLIEGSYRFPDSSYCRCLRDLKED